MDKQLFVYSRGHLLYMNSDDTSIRLKAFVCERRQGLSICTQSQLNSRVPWRILKSEICIDQTTGENLLFVLMSIDQFQDKRFCLVRVSDRDGVYSTNRKTPTFHITCENVFQAARSEHLNVRQINVVLTYGPSVLFAVQNQLILHYFKTTGDAMEHTVFSLPCCKKGENNCSDAMDSTILAHKSEENWILMVILLTLEHSDETNAGDALKTTVVVSLERNECNDMYLNRILETQQFFPVEYVTKLTAVEIKSCEKPYEHERNQSVSVHYNNSCILGLNDGYILLFVNGCLNSCIQLESSNPNHCHVPALVVEQFICFDNSLLICYTILKECYVVSWIKNKVVHHWQDVRKPVLGDFLQKGYPQLLLLFEEWLPEQPETGYLLTDLHGFVLDKRKGLTATDRPVSTLNTSFGNVQDALKALQKQNQSIIRETAEQKRRLEAKQRFAADFWQRSAVWSLNHCMEIVDVPVPEVPLIPILGKPAQTTAVVGCKSKKQLLPCIKVLSTWHRIVENTCIVGVNIINTSESVLSNLSLTLTPAAVAECQTMHYGLLSVTSKSWQHCDIWLNDTAMYFQGNQKNLDSRLHIKRIKIVHPTDNITVTGMFKTPCLGPCSEVVFWIHMHLHLFPQTGSENKQDACFQPSYLTFGHVPLDKCKYQEKIVSCGNLILQASQILQQNHSLSDLMLQHKDHPNIRSASVTEDALALSAIQQCWSLQLSFLVHNTGILSDCLQRAGLVFHIYLRQYVCYDRAPKCLYLARLEVKGSVLHKQREADLLIFARDSNQLLLLLHHLYAYLPDDASIMPTTSASQQNTHIKTITKAMVFELDALRKCARTMLHSHKSSELKPVMDGSPLDTRAEIEESELFVLRQKVHQDIEAGLVGGDFSQLSALVQDCKEKTDIAMAKI